MQRYTLFFIPPNVFEKKFQKYTKNNAELRKIKHRKGEKHTKSRGDREEGGKKEGKKGEKGDPRANTRGTGAKDKDCKKKEAHPTPTHIFIHPTLYEPYYNIRAHAKETNKRKETKKRKEVRKSSEAMPHCTEQEQRNKGKEGAKPSVGNPSGRGHLSPGRGTNVPTVKNGNTMEAEYQRNGDGIPAKLGYNETKEEEMHERTLCRTDNICSFGRTDISAAIINECKKEALSI